MKITSIAVWCGVGLLLPASASGREERGQILVFAAYGSPGRVVVEGRVLEDKGVRPADASRSGAANLVDSFKSFESDEIEGVELGLSIDGQRFAATTDDDGCFRLASASRGPPFKVGRRPLVVEAVANRGYLIPRLDATIAILAADAVAVISDFDDTVAETGVTDKKRMLVHTLTRNAAQMRAVPGAATAYGEALAAGAADVFYVSGSPQNLQPRIVEFLRLQGLPVGPILLKNFGEDSLTEQEGYKLRRIDQLLEAMPGVRFLLVGDSGEKDPEVYREVTRKVPARVVGIVIRQVDGADNDATRLAGMTGVADYTPSPMLLADLVRGAEAGRP